jgi:hypothetical protein
MSEERLVADSEDKFTDTHFQQEALNAHQY